MGGLQSVSMRVGIFIRVKGNWVKNPILRKGFNGFDLCW